MRYELKASDHSCVVHRHTQSPYDNKTVAQLTAVPPTSRLCQFETKYLMNPLCAAIEAYYVMQDHFHPVGRMKVTVFDEVGSMKPIKLNIRRRCYTVDVCIGIWIAFRRDSD